jgi:Ca2+-binding EF-hand superfamily protein
MVARKASSVTPEQLEDFESAFRAFDKNGKNALDLDELAGALSSMGVLEVVRAPVSRRQA